MGGAAAISVALDNYWIIAAVGVLWLFAIIAFSYLTHVAGQVYKAALYLYAVDGTVTAPFDREMLDQAWRFKKA